MSQFSAFGFLFTGFIVGLIVALLTGVLSAIFVGCKEVINRKVEQDIELARIKHEADMEALTRITTRMMEILDQKASNGSFTVKNP